MEGLPNSPWKALRSPKDMEVILCGILVEYLSCRDRRLSIEIFLLGERQSTISCKMYCYVSEIRSEQMQSLLDAALNIKCTFEVSSFKIVPLSAQTDRFV